MSPDGLAAGLDIDATVAHGLHDVVLLDVREAEEWEAGHIPGAVHAPMSRLSLDNPALADRRRTIVCVCRSGARSRRVTDVLSANGYRAVNLLGGMKAWAVDGYPVERSDGNPGTVI